MKRLLDFPTRFYDRWPVWLLVPFGLLSVEVFFLLGIILSSLAIGPALGLYLTLTQNWLAFTDFSLPLHLELLNFLGVALLNLAWVKWVEKRPLASLGFFKTSWFKELSLGFGLGGLQFSLLLALIWLLGGLELTGINLTGRSFLYVLSLIPFWLIQGGTEELLTRGWLLPLLKSKTNLAWAVGLSSSLFGLIHLGNEGVTLLALVNLILAGVSMALYMLWRDNLWSVVGLHAAWNFFQGNVYGVAVSGIDAQASLLSMTNKSGVADWLSGGLFGPEGSLLATVVELAFILYFAYRLRSEQGKGAKQ